MILQTFSCIWSLYYCQSSKIIGSQVLPIRYSNFPSFSISALYLPVQLFYFYMCLVTYHFFDFGLQILTRLKDLSIFFFFITPTLKLSSTAYLITFCWFWFSISTLQPTSLCYWIKLYNTLICAPV